MPIAMPITTALHDRPRRPTAAVLALALMATGAAQAAMPPAPTASSPSAAASTAEAATSDAEAAVAAEPADCIEPVRLSRGIPRYESRAMQNGIQGDVRVHAEIDVDGRVTLAEAIDGPRPLHGSASDFIRGSTYSPKTCGGVPVASTIVATVEYRLSWMSR